MNVHIIVNALFQLLVCRFVENIICKWMRELAMTRMDNDLDFFGALLRHVKQPALVCKITGDIVYMNDMAKELFGDAPLNLPDYFQNSII